VNASRQLAMRDSWAEVTLGDIATIVPGKYLPKSEYVEDGNYFVYGSNSVMGKYSKFLIEPPHTVMAAIGAYAGAVRYSPRPSWVNNNAFGLLVKPAALPGYLFLWLNSMLDLSTVVAGTGQPYVQRPSLNATKVPLPPLSDQKRIVDVINSVDTYIAALQQQAVDARSARNAALHELLTAGGDDWTETTLGEIAEYINGYPFKPEDLGVEGTPVIRIKQLLDPNEACDKTLIEAPNRCVLQSGDIVFSWSGTLAVRVWERERAYLNQHLFRVVEKDGVLHKWLPFVIEHSIRDLSEMTHGTTMKHVTKQTLLPHAVQLPPLSEQQRIVGIVSAMDDVVSATEQAVTDAQKLRSGLLSDLLSGDHEIPETYDRLLGAA
jgi:restriction endonuclease S subunit